MKVAILGLGVVGSAQARMFERAGHDIVTYDPKFNSSYPEDLIRACDFAVISVNTPALPDGSCDLSFVFAAVNALPKGMPVILRSTVPVGTTERLMKLRSGHIVHIPEFMHENPDGAWRESYDVPFLMIGGSVLACEFFKPIMRSVLNECLPSITPPIITGRSSETELAKLVTNSFEAVKVCFVNQVADICEEKNLSYERVRDLWLAHPAVDPSYTKMKGFDRGFGGACLPKDLSDLAHHHPARHNLFSWVSNWNKAEQHEG